jgi:hypothetical protein
MAHRTTYPLDTVKSECTLVTIKLVGNSTSDMTIPETGSECVSCTRSDTGDFALVLRHAYPALKSVVGIELVGATAGLQCRIIAIDPAAKTMTITLEVAGTPTDPASTDTLYINLLMRNSGRNA